MARKTIGFVPLIWECPSCGTQNPGPIKSCTACGAPQPEDVQFLRVDQEKFDFIKDEALIRMAQAGPDIHCPWCGTRNPSTAALCSKCGGELSQGGKLRQQGQRVQTKAEAAVQPPSPKPPQPSPSGAAPKPTKKISRQGMIIGIIAVIVLCVAVIAFTIWGGQSSKIDATVSEVYWERSIALEEYLQVTDSDWCDSIPADAEVLAISQEQRFTSEEPVANATEVCGEEYVVDTGTGVGEVVQDCVYEVYDDYCEYTAWEWTAISPAVANGFDLNPEWPILNLTRNQREGERTEEYIITFAGDDRDYTYSTDDLDFFLQAEPGSTWKLEVTNLNAIKELEPYN